MINKIVIPPRSTRPHSDPVLRFPGDSCLPKSTAKRVAKLVAVIAKAHKLSNVDIHAQVGISHGTYSKLVDDHYITNGTLEKFKKWAATYTKS